MRRIDQLEQGAGQPWVLGNQLGDGFQVRVRHVLLELQVNHDLRLRRMVMPCKACWICSALSSWDIRAHSFRTVDSNPVGRAGFVVPRTEVPANKV